VTAMIFPRSKDAEKSLSTSLHPESFPYENVSLSAISAITHLPEAAKVYRSARHIAGYDRLS